MRSLNLPSLTAALVLLAGSALPVSLCAEERVVYYAEPTGNNDNFFQRVGQFFRDLFPAEQNLSPRATPPQPTAPRYNLDLPPPGAGYGSSYGSHHVSSAHEQQAVTATEQSRAVTHSAATKAMTGKRAAPTDSSTEVAEKIEKPKPTSKSKKPSANYAESPPEPAPKKIVSTTSTTTTSTPKAPSDAASVLTGTRTSKSTRVKSPYPPYNELDVSGLPSGSLAQDPTTQKIFRVP